MTAEERVEDLGFSDSPIKPLIILAIREAEAEARASEREICAKIANEHYLRTNHCGSIAEKIRQRKDQ